MFDLNIVCLIGNLTKDPELAYTKNKNMPYCKFTIANNPDKEKEKVNFFDITTWSGTAESCAKFLKKGSKVAIEGILRRTSWTGKDGQKKYGIEITARSVNFISSPGGKQEKREPENADVFPTEAFAEQ